MYVPCLRQDGTQSTGSRSCPERSFVLDLRDQQVGRRGRAVEHAVVAMLPGHPRDQQSSGGKALLHGLWRVPPRRAPPLGQGFLAGGRAAWQA